MARSCGGCPHIETLPHVTLRNKRAAVLGSFEAFGCRPRRVGAFLEESPLAYRNRIRLRVTEDGSIGFFNEHKARDCAVVEPALRRTIDVVTEQLSESRSMLRAFDYLEIRTPDACGSAGLFLGQVGARRKCADAIDEARAHIADRLAPWSVLVARAGDDPMPVQKFRWIESVYHYVPLDGFMQVNGAINRALLGWIGSVARQAGARSVVDLYCGSGNVLLPLVALGMEGVGVERNGTSCAAARRAAEEQGLHARFVAADVGTWLADSARTFDLAVVDAPRAGLKGDVEHLLRLAPPHVVIVSCNAASLVRDARALYERGYDARELRGFDMFAYTEHHEWGLWLHRGQL